MTNPNPTETAPPGRHQPGEIVNQQCGPLTLVYREEQDGGRS